MPCEENNAIEELSLADALERGLGRAVVMLEAGGRNVNADRAVIFHACRNNLRHDTQCEECRAPYLFDILHATGEPDFYADLICAELRDSHKDDEDFAWHQMIEIAARFVRMGRGDLRPAIYESVARLLARGGDAGASTLVRLDGARGYRFLLQQVAHLPRAEDVWEEEALLDELIACIDEEPAKRLSQRLAAKSPDFQAYLERVWSAREQSATARERRWAKPNNSAERVDYAAAMAWVDAPPGKSPSPSCYRISSDMDEATALRVAADLLAETDRARLARFLRLFGRRSFPLDIAPLIDLARSNDEKVSWYSLRVLERVSAPTVRAFGLELAETPDRQHLAPILLINNPGPADLDLFRSLLDRSFNDFEYHRMATDLRNYFKANLTTGVADCLIKLYERGPCSMCRYSIVEMLLDDHSLPDALRRECVYDAYSSTRELVAEHPASVKSV